MTASDPIQLVTGINLKLLEYICYKCGQYIMLGASVTDNSNNIKNNARHTV